MQVSKIQKSVKNTFLNQAKNAGNEIDKKYYESLHLEAMGRMYYLKHRKVEHQLTELHAVNTFKDALKFTKLILKSGYRKFQSVLYGGEAYERYEKRFHNASYNRGWVYKK